MSPRRTLAATAKSSGAPRALVAGHPFDNVATDVTFITSDGVQFFVYKVILAVASPFFRDMFSLAQPSTRQSPTQEPIAISEDSQTWDHLLRLCYPVKDPIFHDARDVGKVLQAALKYQLDEAAELATKLLHNFLSGHVLDVYAIACISKLESEAKRAARVWRKAQTFTDTGAFSSTVAGAAYSSSMAKVSAGAYFRLIQYGVGERVLEQPFCEPEPIGSDCDDTGAVSSESTELYTDDADVIIQSSDGINFPAHILVLRIASAEALLGDDYKSLPADENGTGLPLATVNVPSGVLSRLLALCYPLRADTGYTGDLHTTCTLIRTAAKYNMTRVVTRIRDNLQSHISTHPLAIFFLAVELGWKKEAEACCKASVAVDVGSSSYISSMEHARADSYHKFLEYRHACRAAVFEVVSGRVPRFSRAKITDQQLAVELSPHPATFSSALVERELVKAANAAKCPSPSQHTYGGRTVTPDYDMNLTALAQENVRMNEEIHSRLSKVCPSCPWPVSAFLMKCARGPFS